MNSVADKKRENAGYNGEMSDGGASALEAEVAAFFCGYKNVFPAKWNKEIKTMEKLLDPEYQTYLELKKKFEE